MKKFLGVILVLVCFITPAFAEPVSQEVLNQARTQAGLFMDLKNALGLDWLDKYNAYLDDPTSFPEPSWASSVTELINKNYLSTAFPTDFTITPTGQEVTISRIITSQGIKDALPIYLPAVTISGDTVSLLVQRPAQWVAWEDALASKVSRAGDDNPDILPGASLEFGSGSKIEFINNDGKLVGINSLTYKGQELEDRFVNAAGDNMTGPLTIEGNKVWHAGNDGSGSGLDADLLDGQHGSFYRNASNLNAGIVPIARLSGTYDINISGNAATASKLATARTISLTGNASGSASFDGSGNISINTSVSYASNADTVDGKHASAFASASHGHGEYVQKAGDTATGPIYFRGGLSAEAQSKDDITTRTPSGFWQTNSATTGEGWPQTTNTWYHLLSSTHSNTGNYYAMQFAGNFYNSNDIYYRSTNGSGTTPWNKMWHSGNDGSGSGLDADLLDGKHASAFASSGHTHNYVSKSGDTMTGVLTAPEYRINDANTRIYEGSGNSVRIQTNSGYVDIGSQNTSWAHFNTDRANFYFNKPVNAVSQLKVYNTNTYLTATEGRINNQPIWHKGNDGSGSGLDADKVDGKHASSFVELDRFGATSTGGTLDWNHVSNTRPGTGHTLLMGNAANGPGPAVYFHAFNLEYASKDGTGNVTQFAIPYGSSSAINTGIYYRGRYNGTWTDWQLLGQGLVRNGIKKYFAGYDNTKVKTYTWTPNAGTKYVFAHAVGGCFHYGPDGNNNSYFGSYVIASSAGYEPGVVFPRKPKPGEGIKGDIKVTGDTSTGLSGYPPYGCAEISYTLEYDDGYHLRKTSVYPGGYAAGWVNVTGVSSVPVGIDGNGAVIVEEFK